MGAIPEPSSFWMARVVKQDLAGQPTVQEMLASGKDRPKETDIF